MNNKKTSIFREIIKEIFNLPTFEHISNATKEIIKYEKQISFLDIVRFLIAFFIAHYTYLKIETWGFSLRSDSLNIGNILVVFFIGVGVASFLAILLAGIIVSWRYKLVVTILMMYPFIIFHMVPLFDKHANFFIFLLLVVKVTFAFLGSVGAIYIWDAGSGIIKNKHLKYKKEIKSKIEPKISFLLVLLSIISIPLTFVAIFTSTFVILGLSALLGYLLINLPRIPVVLIVAAIVAPLIGIWATIKSLWAICFPKSSFQQAVLIDVNKTPVLNKIIKEVCDKVRTNKPNSVILHAEPTFFVMQGKINTFDGFAKGRILAIGMPLLSELSVSEFKSIMAHEFAHFSGRDTLYSTIVSPVYRGIAASLDSLKVDNTSAGSGVGNATTILMLPSMFFFGLFLKYFATIDMILSRSRELRADLVSANLFGGNNFSSALTKVVTISQHFNDNCENLALSSHEDLFKKHSGILKIDPSKLEEYKTKSLLLKEDDFDSHPTLATRLFNLSDETKYNPKENEIEMSVIKEELSEKEKELSKKYTDWFKRIKEYYEQYKKIVYNYEKQKQMLIVSNVNSKSKAEQVGIEAGDRIAKVCGEDIKNEDDVQKVLQNRDKSNPVRIELIRNGQPIVVELVLNEDERIGINFQ